jgi:hypothetical protein
MLVTRGTTLAALVLVALAAPVTAFALSDDAGDASRSSEHSAKAQHDKSEKAEHDEAGEDGLGDEKSAPGRLHAQEMKDWVDCVAEAASGPKDDERTGPPKDACDDKPAPPGLEKREAARGDASAPGKSGEHRGQGQSRGHSG